MRKLICVISLALITCILLCSCSAGSSVKPDTSTTDNGKKFGEEVAAESSNEQPEQTAQETSKPAEETSVAQESSDPGPVSDFESGTQHGSFYGLEFDCPKNWSTKDGEEGFYYYYPSHDNGMVMLMYEYIEGASTYDPIDAVNALLQGMMSGLDSFERKSEITKKTNKNGVVYYKNNLSMSVSGQDMDTIAYFIFSDDNVYNVYCSNYVGSSYDSFPDYEKLGDTFAVSKTSTSNTPTPSSQSAQTSAPLQIELVEYGCTMMSSGYVYYGVVLHNPNEDIAIQFPSFRVTARDADGILLGTEDQTLSIIYPGETVAHGFLGFKVDEEPATYEVQMLPFPDYGVLKKGQYTPTEKLEVINYAMRDSKIVGEINNPNNRSFDTVAVTVIYRDSEGNIVFGDSTFVSDVAANSTTPFELSNYHDVDGYDFELYASEW